MLSNYSEGLYNDATRIADQILKSNPNDAQALNLKGGIAFYNEEYESAVEYFRRAHNADPKSDQYTSNYANALIETKAYHVALELFKSIDDGKRDRSYALGRANFYVGNYSDAEMYLETVPADYWHGAGKIIEAAALLSLAKRESVTDKKAELESRARSQFTYGYSADPGYWAGILAGATKDKCLSEEFLNHMNHL